jgi:fumarate reductase subunit C
MIQPTEYVPRAYHPRLSTYWWLARWAYLKFILRELSSLFVAWSVVFTLLQIYALQQGPAAYAEFQRWAGTPVMLIVNAVSLMFVTFHAVTWFNLAPRAMAVRMRGKRLPDLAIAGPNYVAWIVASAVVAWIVLGVGRG